MVVGHANKNKIFYSKAKGINKAVVYVGSKLVEMVFMAHQWPLQNLMKILMKKNQLFK